MSSWRYVKGDCLKPLEIKGYSHRSYVSNSDIDRILIRFNKGHIFNVPEDWLVFGLNVYKKSGSFEVFAEIVPVVENSCGKFNPLPLNIPVERIREIVKNNGMDAEVFSVEDRVYVRGWNAPNNEVRYMRISVDTVSTLNAALFISKTANFLSAVRIYPSISNLGDFFKVKDLATDVMDFCREGHEKWEWSCAHRKIEVQNEMKRLHEEIEKLDNEYSKLCEKSAAALDELESKWGIKFDFDKAQENMDASY